jgi:hypothetical protein
MLRRDLMTEPEVWSKMVDRFPWVAEERGSEGEGLTHLEFAALRRGLERADLAEDFATVREICGFVEELISDRLSLHPDVENAIDVSFVEDLYLTEHWHREIVEASLGPATRARWDEVKNWPPNSTG